MSQLSESWAVTPSGRGIYCVVIGNYVSSCSRMDTCGACKTGKSISKEGKNVKKRPERTQKESIIEPYIVQKEPQSNVDFDQKGSGKRRTSPKIGTNDAPRTIKVDNSDSGGAVPKVRRRKGATK